MCKDFPKCRLQSNKMAGETRRYRRRQRGRGKPRRTRCQQRGSGKVANAFKKLGKIIKRKVGQGWRSQIGKDLRKRVGQEAVKRGNKFLDDFARKL